MRSSRFVKRTLVAGVAVLPFLAPQPAASQFRSDQAGGALDANRRVDNAANNQVINSQIPNNGVTGNRIVTGNVTGGKQFRGEVPYTDPREFRGSVAGAGMDNFIRDSSGSGWANQAPRAAWQTEGFYGASRLAEPPPPGFVDRGFSGAYTTGAPKNHQSFMDGPTGPFNTSSSLFAPGNISSALTSPMGFQTGRSSFAASPLLGLRQWNSPQSSDRSLLSESDTFWGNSGASSWQRQNLLDRMRWDLRTIQQMREELYRTGGDGDPRQPSPGPNDPSSPGDNLAKPLPQPFDSPQGKSLNQPLDPSIANSAISAQVRTDQAFGDRLAVPPSQQSSQYAELQRRLNRYYTSRLETDEDRHREFLKQLRARDAADKAANDQKTPEDTQAQPPAPIGKGTIRPTAPDYARIGQELTLPRPRSTTSPQTQPVTPQPVQVASLAAGIKAQGLATLLRNAEEALQQGKYMTAIDHYAAAERVAPNNSLVWIGRAHAELAAAYYRRAEQDLRQTLTRDPTLMMGRYDLKTMIGQQRLETIVRDLKDVAKRQESDSGPVFLLAYLAYNTGHVQPARMYLDEAEKRAGDKSNFYKLVRQHWTLTETGSNTQDNTSTTP